ncbi:voltage-dependent calcium channel subunit alpha-2/delta-4 [Electrophorus electricus]|uniref:voltage-dependent calcium channel subunit alpha-2/delta-4 n=1 Tax=Electrophorus electricus TaxID=8005 RepID=UPI0015D03494|nr:voltage-dependent calcium channel subunit alpha-2/delta-4 [Electrophorus electricus]
MIWTDRRISIAMLWIVSLRWICLSVGAQMMIPPEIVQQWANTFGKQLFALSTRYSGSQLLQKKYKDVEPIVKIEKVDGMELVKKFAKDMENMLGRKMDSVKKMAETAEDADLYHEYNATLKFDYYNAMLINTLDEDGNYVELGGEFPLDKNEHFNRLSVNIQQSVIQVPTSVYNKDPDILNGVYMSEALNEVFVSNYEKDPTLTWQYFGSPTGFLRLYPGIQWTPDENGVVTFDVRNRNWYIQAATSPKDIIIVVDASGSMKGLRMTIAKHTINTILNTLGENDFVNVIAYTDYVQYLDPCFKGTLVQANQENREHFKLLVGGLHVKGEGKVKKAVKEAFHVLNEAVTMGKGSLCNQAIMLITDGAMEDFQQVFEEFNWPERRVRVFTYLIGREVTFAENVKWIACNNKGYYAHISTLADVQQNVMEYLHVLSRPMVISHSHDIIWTEAYMDTVLFSTQAQSLQLMSSVAMPVFSKKEKNLSHGVLLGVVGTDVPLKALMRLAPQFKLGVHGYAFLNTNNGYILSHPDLRPLYKEGKKLKPKPNYNSVDLSEIEWQDTDDALRTAMVKGTTGTLSLDVRTTLDKGRRVMFLKNDYFYTTINETPFSLGIMLPQGHGKFIFTGNISVEEGLHDLTASDVMIANEWTYCETDSDPNYHELTQLQAVAHYLTGKEPDLRCDEVLLKQTLFDVVVTAPMEAYWTAILLNASGIDDGIETAFIGTRSGLLRTFRYVGAEKRVAKRFLTPSDKENLFTLNHFPVWYRHAVENPAGNFLYYAPQEDMQDGGILIAVTSVTVTVDQKTAVAGAVGVQMSLRMVKNSFWDITTQTNDTDCAGIEGLCPLSCTDSLDLSCYVIDSNGFIIISKETSEVGRFLGEIDGSVMSQLLQMGMFKSVSLYDYQAMCKVNPNSANSARPLLSPFYNLMVVLRWFLSNVLLFLLDFNSYSLWHSDIFAEAKASFHASSKKTKGDILQPCDTEYFSFIYQPSVKETNSFIECGRCQKAFVIQHIPESNLLLIVVQADCDCSRQYSSITMEPREVKYNASVKCERMKSQKIRRRPKSCHAYHPQENAKDCGGAAEMQLSTIVFLTSLFVSSATDTAT